MKSWLNSDTCDFVFTATNAEVAQLRIKSRESVSFISAADFFTAQFFGPKVDSYSKKNSYSQSGGKLPSKGVITYHTLISGLHSTQHLRISFF